MIVTRYARYLATFVSLIIICITTSCNNESPKDGPQQNSKPPLQVSVLLPLTGPGASGGSYSKNGFEMAVEEIRTKGGQIEVTYEDTRTDPKTAVSVFQSLQASSNPPNVLVPQLSSVMKALQPMLSEDMLTVATGVSVPGVSDSSRRRFSIFLSSTGIAKTAARWAISNNVKKPCVIYVNDEYGQSCLTSFKKSFAAPSVISEPFGLLEKDFRGQWQKIIGLDVDCVFIAGYGPGYLTVIKQMREQGYQGMVITDWSITAPDYMTALTEAVDGAYVVSVKVPSTFADKYRSIFGKEGSYINAGYSYDTLKCIWYSHSNSDGSVEGMAKALISMKDYPGIMDSEGIQENGELLVRYSIFHVLNGKLTTLENESHNAK
jgi:branched-chain amino acid transport system substrate-binding protein